MTGVQTCALPISGVADNGNTWNLTEACFECGGPVHQFFGHGQVPALAQVFHARPGRSDGAAGTGAHERGRYINTSGEIGAHEELVVHPFHGAVQEHGSALGPETELQKPAFSPIDQGAALLAIALLAFGLAGITWRILRE